MKRNVFVIIALMGAVGFASPALRTPEDALRIASEFVSNTPTFLQSEGRSYSVAVLQRSGLTAKRSNSAIDQSPITNHQLHIADSSAAYFAVNTESGFVLVGADERMPDVLGYSDSGAFDADSLPPAMRFLLQCYAEELANREAVRLLTNHQSPITNLLTCQWNQSKPFNNLAPAYNNTGGQCASGCVATAMAQVMYYHKHPAQGTGSHSYLWVCSETPALSKTLSADFANTTYDWANMLDNYKSSYTSAQAEAVATLMYHCGVAVEMGYGASSGAFTQDVPKALNTYFGYDANYQRIQKIMYPADSLNAIIYSELAARRPVIVSGSNDEGGHAFVCDGADNRGYFHINWGWGGNNDGYYLLTALNPGKSQGIGGTTKGYNQSTAFFIGLQPAKTGTPKAIPQMATTSFSISSESFTRTTAFSVSIARLQNYGLTNFSGSYGVALYDEDETQLVAVLKQENNYSLKAGYYRTTAATLSSITIPNTVPEGNYHLCAVYKDADYGWMRMMCTEDDYYLSLSIEGSQVTVYPNNAEPELALTKAISFGEDINTDSVPKTGAPLSFAVKNTGGTFRGQISARIYKGAFSKGQYEIIDSVVIRRNETLASALQQAFEETLLLDTQYKMKLCWRTDADSAWNNFDGELPFKLYDPDYHLALTEDLHFDDNDSVPVENANFYYSIKNTGAPFTGELQLFFYEDSLYSRGQSELRAVTIGTNETLTDAFSGPLEQPAGNYLVILRYRETDGEWQEFYDVYGRNISGVGAKLYAAPPDDPDIPTAVSQITDDQSPMTNDQSPITNDQSPITNDQSPITNKVLLRNGQLLIIHNGKTYNAQGARVK